MFCCGGRKSGRSEAATVRLQPAPAPLHVHVLHVLKLVTLPLMSWRDAQEAVGASARRRKATNGRSHRGRHVNIPMIAGRPWAPATGFSTPSSPADARCLPSPLLSSRECRICLDDEADDQGGLLNCGCACRGTAAGLVHLIGVRSEAGPSEPQRVVRVLNVQAVLDG